MSNPSEKFASSAFCQGVVQMHKNNLFQQDFRSDLGRW